MELAGSCCVMFRSSDGDGGEGESMKGVVEGVQHGSLGGQPSSGSRTVHLHEPSKELNTKPRISAIEVGSLRSRSFAFFLRQKKTQKLTSKLANAFSPLRPTLSL